MQVFFCKFFDESPGSAVRFAAATVFAGQAKRTAQGVERAVPILCIDRLPVLFRGDTETLGRYALAEIPLPRVRRRNAARSGEHGRHIAPRRAKTNRGVSLAAIRISLTSQAPKLADAHAARPKKGGDRSPTCAPLLPNGRHQRKANADCCVAAIQCRSIRAPVNFDRVSQENGLANSGNVDPSCPMKTANVVGEFLSIE